MIDMTLDRLREIAAARRRLDDEEAEILDALASTQPAAFRVPANWPGRGKLVNIAVAERVSGMSRTWIYSLARRRPDIGWKTETAGWRFDEAALRAIFDKPPRAKSAICAESADEIISTHHSSAYPLNHQEEGNTNE